MKKCGIKFSKGPASKLNRLPVLGGWLLFYPVEPVKTAQNRQTTAGWVLKRPPIWFGVKRVMGTHKIFSTSKYQIEQIWVKFRWRFAVIFCLSLFEILKNKPIKILQRKRTHLHTRQSYFATCVCSKASIMTQAFSSGFGKTISSGITAQSSGLFLEFCHQMEIQNVILIYRSKSTAVIWMVWESTTSCSTPKDLELSHDDDDKILQQLSSSPSMAFSYKTYKKEFI